MEFNKIDGVIKYEDMMNAIEQADTIEEVVALRIIIEDEFVESCLECSMKLSEKEELYNL